MGNNKYIISFKYAWSTNLFVTLIMWVNQVVVMMIRWYIYGLHSSEKTEEQKITWMNDWWLLLVVLLCAMSVVVVSLAMMMDTVATQDSYISPFLSLLHFLHKVLTLTAVHWFQLKKPTLSFIIIITRNNDNPQWNMHQLVQLTQNYCITSVTIIFCSLFFQSDTMKLLWCSCLTKKN